MPQVQTTNGGIRNLQVWNLLLGPQASPPAGDIRGDCRRKVPGEDVYTASTVP